MNNFTKSNGKAYWHSITNLTCCSIDLSKAKRFSMKAFMFFVLLAFSFGSMYAQKVELPSQRSTFYEVCIDDRPAGFTEEEVAELYASLCEEGTEITVTKSEVLTGDDCAWSVYYTYVIKCGEFEDELKIFYEGGDVAAPELIGEVPSGETGLDLCFDQIPAGPSAEDIAALFEDNCGNVNVQKFGEPTGDDCEWSVTYKYTIVDDCGNAAADVEITYSGGDSSPPGLDKDSVIPSGEEGLNLCYDDRPEGPSEAEIAALFADNCGNVNVIKAEKSKGDDCQWVSIIYYSVYDDCGNYTDEITIVYSGGDTEAPEFLQLPEEEITVSCIDEIPPTYDLPWQDNCAKPEEKAYGDDNTDNLGIACEGGYVLRTWTITDNCGNETSFTQTINVEPAPPAEFDIPQDYSIDCSELANFEPQYLGYSNGVEGGACEISGEVQGVADPFDGSCGEFLVHYEFTDECGRMISATQTITVEDNTPPAFDPPAQDMTVECDGNGNMDELQAWLDNNGGAIAYDNCGNISWSNDYGQLSDECGATGSVTVTFTATDDCGNSASTTATFTIEDTTPPTLDVEAQDLTVECDGQGNLQDLEDWLNSNGGASASDLCGDVSWYNNYSVMAENCGLTGNTVVDFTAVDECGNDVKTTAVFRIIDTTPPSMEDAQDMTVECDGEGNLQELQDWLNSNGGAYAEDLCGEVTWSNNFNGLSDECGETGSATVDFTATDECGNEAKTTATFTIQDTNSPPITNAAEDMTVECDGNGNLEELQAWLDNNAGATAYDICSDITWSNDYDGQFTDECGLTGSITVMFTVTDDCGLSSSTSATFTIEDTTPPVIEPGASDMTVECDGQGNLQELEDWLNNNGGASASDICGGVTWSNNFTGLSDDCGETGSATVEFTATDDCGNESKTSATFTIEDTTPPSIDVEAQDMTVECDGAGNLQELEDWLNNNGGASASDICSGVTWSNNFTALSDECGATGSAIVEFTATDECGNESKTSATFTIEDTTPPSMEDAMDMTVECDGAGNLQELEDWLNSNGGAYASDICGDVTWSNNFEALSDDCGATGSATVEFTATDDCGNESKTTATFTIVDTVPPTIDVPAMDMTVECDGQGNLADLEAWLNNNGGASASDICSDVTWSNNFGQLSDECGATGSVLVEFTATDDCGNESKTSATFTIEDTTPPGFEVLPQDMTVECDGNGNLDELQAWLDNNGGGYAYDICGGITWSNNFTALSDDCGATGSATVEFTVTDECGNESKASATFTIEDTTNPSIDIEAQDMTVECDGQGNLADLEAWLDNNGGASASDICSGVTWSNDFTALSDDCGATGSALVVFTATDECGNESKTSATFTIEDTTPPSMEDAMDMTVECDGAGNLQELEDWLNSNGGAYASDICSDVTWSNNYDGLSDDCGETGSATVEFTATDDCGNESKTTATFTIEDTVPPTIDIPAEDMTVECDGQGNLADLEAWLLNNAGASASDICSDVTWSYICLTANDDPNKGSTGHKDTILCELSDECGATGSVTVEFIATDDCGNESKTSATFTIEDTTPPVLTDAQDETVECSDGSAPCEYNIYLYDSYGDGWNGASINVYVNGGLVHDGISASGYGSGPFAIPVNTGDIISTSYISTGSFPSEISYEILDSDNVQVASETTGNVDSLAAACPAGQTSDDLFADWLANNGGATAEDMCGDVTWSNNSQGLSDDCGFTGSETVEFTATDECGNESKTTATFTVVDTTPPTITADAMDMTVECDGAGNLAELEAWLANNGGAAASDNCGDVTWSNDFTGLSDDCGATGSATVTFTATDECGNESTTTATFTIEDTTDPYFTYVPEDITLECDQPKPVADATADDQCGSAEVTYVDYYDHTPWTPGNLWRKWYS